MCFYYTHTNIYGAGRLSDWLAWNGSDKRILSFLMSEPFDGFGENHLLCIPISFHHVKGVKGHHHHRGA